MKALFLSLTLLAPMAEASDTPECRGNICVGDMVYNSYSNTHQKVLGFSRDYVVLENPSGGVSQDWERKYIVVTKSGTCTANLEGNTVLPKEVCVGDRYFNTYNKLEMEVAGINQSGGVFLKSETGQITGYWEPKYLARLEPGFCAGKFCIGDKVWNSYTSKYAKVAYLAHFGPWIQYDGGDISGYWEEHYLKIIERAQEALDREELEKKAAAGAVDAQLYQRLRKEGLSHKEALDKASGPMLLAISDAEQFLDKLSQFVYRFDSIYLKKISALLVESRDKERRTLFVLNALSPYFRNSGYKGVKERFLDPSVARIEHESRNRGVTTLADIEPSLTTRKLAGYMLAVSLETAMPQLNESQKALASEILRILSNGLAQGMKYRDMVELYRILPSYRAMLLELSQNLYLQARVATDMLLLEYLENS